MTICGMNFFFGVFDRVTIERSGWTGWKPTYTVSFKRCCAITQLEDNMMNILTTTMDNVVNDYLAAQCDSALDENEEEDDPPFNRP